MKTILKLLILGVVIVGCFAFAQSDTLKASVERGKTVYTSNCIGCHMETGEGLSGMFPPLVNTGRLSDKGRLVKIMYEGIKDPITVNGTEYSMEMYPMTLSEREVADVLNYIRNSWGNKHPEIKIDEVKSLRVANK